MCRYESVEAGERVFKEGSESDKLYLIVSGRAQVVANRISRDYSESHLALEQRVTLQRSLECNGRPGIQSRPTEENGVEEITIAELDSGSFFGEQGLVFGTKRACGVKAVEKSLLLSVSKSDFANFVKVYPQAKQKLVNSVKSRMLRRMESLKIPFLAGITSDMISSLADSIELDEFPANTNIFSQGEEGDRFFIIVHGTVRVTVTETSDAEKYNHEVEEKEVKEIGVLGPGSYFGELSLLEASSQLRTATVTTVDRSLLLSVDKESFRTIFGNAEGPLQAEFELRLLRESACLQHVLNHPLGMTSFRDFLLDEHAEENLDFVTAIISFQLDNANGSHIQTKAQVIFDKYVSEASQSQVNLPAKMVDEIKHVLGTKSAHLGLFLDARREIMQMMEQDNFSRYKQSRYFKAFKERLGIL